MYSDEQLQELRQYEAEIRHAEIKSLCNGIQVTKMRMIIKNLLDHIGQPYNNAIQDELLPVGASDHIFGSLSPEKSNYLLDGPQSS